MPFYNARYYDPAIGRFISADTIVPGNASGGMDGVAVKPLTVGLHEGGFLGKLNQENRAGFWFQLNRDQRQQLGSPMGPANAQALNRYAYVQNNPLKYTDPTGHIVLDKEQAREFHRLLGDYILPALREAQALAGAANATMLGGVAGFIGGAFAAWAGTAAAKIVTGSAIAGFISGLLGSLASFGPDYRGEKEALDIFTKLYDELERFDGNPRATHIDIWFGGMRGNNATILWVDHLDGDGNKIDGTRYRVSSRFFQKLKHRIGVGSCQVQQNCP